LLSDAKEFYSQGPISWSFIEDIGKRDLDRVARCSTSISRLSVDAWHHDSYNKMSMNLAKQIFSRDILIEGITYALATLRTSNPGLTISLKAFCTVAGIYDSYLT
jgi:hypothetical protein